MSGASVPYHLRTNKFVERQLFLDVLDFVRIWNGPSKYFYASMGGRFLEDFKILHERYAIDRMVSIELDETTWQRQKFNRPLGCIECLKMSSGEFTDNFSEIFDATEDSLAIVWLDYTEANKKGEQLQEFQQLVSKLKAGDVAKITLNANFQSKHQRANFKSKAKFEADAIDYWTEELDGYLPGEGVLARDLTPARFPQLLAKSVKIAALNGIASSPNYEVFPLASFRYSDGQQMLTITSMVTDEEIRSKIEADDHFSQWPCRSREWDEIREINVPIMSQRERVYINRHISRRDENTIHDAMPFRLEAEEGKSLEQLKNYVEHYRRYPAFGRVYV